MTTINKPRWIMDLTNNPDLRKEIAEYGPDAFMVCSPYATPRGEELDKYVATPGFRQYTEHEDGGLVSTPEMRYLKVGMIGTDNIGATSGGVVVPIREGIDLPMPSRRYIVRVEEDWGADLLTVSRIHVIDGEEHVEGSVSAWCGNVGELVYRASCYVNWDATEWIDESID
jgi:hypothetical protein